MRRSSIGKCRYDTTFLSGGEDWDFWLCLAERGNWGGTLPELAYWYRINDAAFRKARWGSTFDGGQRKLRDRIQRKHKSFTKSADRFPTKMVAPSVSLEDFHWEAPFQNSISETARRGSIMVVLPWLFMGGADIGALRIIEILTKAGYRVTVVCTLYKYPESIELRPQVLQWTHDLHILPSFLRANDFPRYIKYLADSRGIDLLMLSNSMLAYEMLPALREQLPKITIVDYLHNEAYDGWKSGGYPTYSLLHQRYIDHTITCSYHLRRWLAGRGQDQSRVGVVKLGVDLQKLSASMASMQKLAIRKNQLKASKDTTILLSVARLDPQKRTLLIPEIITRLVERYGYTCGARTSQPLLMVMVGSGPLADELRYKIEELDLEECFYLAGTQADATPYYAAADLFLLPSVSEGISVAVSEAMGAGLPLVAANAGALPEQVGKDLETNRAGLLVKHTMRVAEDADLYAKTVDYMLADRMLMERLSENGLKRVQQADWHYTLQALLPEFEKAKRSHRNQRTASELAKLPNPAAHMAIQTQLNEFRSMFDLSLTQGALSPVTRKGFGREVQLRCGESESLSAWTDALEDPIPCRGEARYLNAKEMQRSAVHQCGQCASASGLRCSNHSFRVYMGSTNRQASRLGFRVGHILSSVLSQLNEY